LFRCNSRELSRGSSAIQSSERLPSPPAKAGDTGTAHKRNVTNPNGIGIIGIEIEIEIEIGIGIEFHVVAISIPSPVSISIPISMWIVPVVPPPISAPF